MKSLKHIVLFAAVWMVFCFACAETSPAVLATTTTIAAPMVTPTPANPEPVLVAEPAAPPKWAEDLIVSVQKFPVIGPIVSKALLYAGILSSILTGLVAFLLATLGTLAGAFNLGGLVKVAEAITVFKNGKFMYWLSYLSMFNAKKPEEKKT